jgi:hypothetical protein
MAPRLVLPGLPTGRIKEGRRLRAFRVALIRHVGGAPSRVQIALIDRATLLQCHVSRMDTQALQDGGMSDHASRQYLAWSNTLTRTLRQLGVNAATTAPAETVLQRLQREATTQPTQPPPTPPTAAPGRLTPPTMMPRMHQPEVPAHGVVPE